MPSRRRFLSQSAVIAASLAAPSQAASGGRNPATCDSLSLSGKWKFQIDPDDEGTRAHWQLVAFPASDWREVTVPHTWQVDPVYADYRGAAWYRRTFDVLTTWRDAALRLQFDAVFHSATVWVNGQWVGEHSRNGYTAFSLDITSALRWDQPNLISVRVDNAFNDHICPADERATGPMTAESIGRFAF